jgi:hypothetical protein
MVFRVLKGEELRLTTFETLKRALVMDEAA